MDFGIKAALATALNVINDAARGTGRTTWAISHAVQTGACLGTATRKEQDRIRRRVMKEGKPEIDVYVIATLRDLIEVQSRAGLTKPIVLDHTSHEALYREALQNVEHHVAAYDEAYRKRYDAAAAGARAAGYDAIPDNLQALSRYEHERNLRGSAFGTRDL